MNRHSWRCPSKITGPAHPAHNLPIQGGPGASFQGNIAPGISPTPSANAEVQLEAVLTTCVCGRSCRGRRGLAAHQRSCRVYNDLLRGPTSCSNNTAGRDLSEETFTNSTVDKDSTCDAGGADERTRNSIPELKLRPDLRLPKSNSACKNVTRSFTFISRTG